MQTIAPWFHPATTRKNQTDEKIRKEIESALGVTQSLQNSTDAMRKRK